MANIRRVAKTVRECVRAAGLDFRHSYVDKREDHWRIKLGSRGLNEAERNRIERDILSRLNDAGVKYRSAGFDPLLMSRCPSPQHTHLVYHPFVVRIPYE